MAFTDNFNGAGSDTSLESWTPSGGGSWTLQSGASGAIAVRSTGSIKAISTTASVYTCTDQGTADHYVQCRDKYFNTALASAFVAVRLVDADNFVAWRIATTGSTGRRLTQRIAGVNTDLITSQGVDEEFIRVEAQGTTFRLYQGGTGGSPSWTQVGTDQTVLGLTTETSIGLRISNNVNTDWIDDFEAGPLSTTSSFTISPSGGISFSGTNSQIRGKILFPSGGVTFGGTVLPLHGKVFSISGGLLFGGTAALSSGSGANSFTLSPTGGLILSGTNVINLSKLFNISGGITFGGTGSLLKTKVLTPIGGIVFSGTANLQVPGSGGSSFVGTIITLRRNIGRR